MWDRRSSDISYYLNSHHVDFLTWAVEGLARPVVVTAYQATGVANARGLPVDCADTITLTVQYAHRHSAALGVATFTASWVAAPSDGHTQQGFSVLGHGGQLAVDQTHRGYTVATHAAPGVASINPLYMRCVRVRVAVGRF